MYLEHKWIRGHMNMEFWVYIKTCLQQPLSKRPQIGFQDQLSLNAGQKYCRMLEGEHSAILLTFIKLPFVIKICVFLSGRLRQVLLLLLRVPVPNKSERKRMCKQKSPWAGTICSVSLTSHVLINSMNKSWLSNGRIHFRNSALKEFRMEGIVCIYGMASLVCPWN